MKNTTPSKREARLRKWLPYWQENNLDLLSLGVAIISLIITIGIGIKANEIAVSNQPLDYSVTANAHIELVLMDDAMFTAQPVVFQQKKGIWSGDLSSVFIATVDGQAVDIVYVPDKMDDTMGFHHQVGEKMMYFIPPEQPNNLFFNQLDISGRDANDALRCFHLIFKAHNKEYTIYTVVFTLDALLHSTMEKEETGETIANFGHFNVYVLSEDNMYDFNARQQIAADLNAGKAADAQVTPNQVLDMIIAQRNLCYETLVGTN